MKYFYMLIYLEQRLIGSTLRVPAFHLVILLWRWAVPDILSGIVRGPILTFIQLQRIIFAENSKILYPYFYSILLLKNEKPIKFFFEKTFLRHVIRMNFRLRSNFIRFPLFIKRSIYRKLIMLNNSLYQFRNSEKPLKLFFRIK